MKVSLNWLREFVTLPANVPALTDLLTLAGVEVEGVQTLGVAIPKVVVAQILSSEQHPNADRLSVCKVDDGSGHPRQIVCGAKNYRVGDKVPLALPGAVLPGDFKIKVGKLRGVESEGMMCSAEELGLPKGEDGLLILPSTAPVGSSFSDLFPGDTVLDLEITPNRPDLLSHYGIAREIAALTGQELNAMAPAAIHGALFETTRRIEVATSACPLYTAVTIKGVKVGPSPDWLRHKLEAVGLRPINNIVDITNLVMLEVGQPLHAFDAAKVNGDIRVRPAQAGEQFLALDGRTYTLQPGHVVIADAESALALAGVMGGELSGVTASTTDIILESALFDSSTIRRTSRELGLSSDSSYRFERGVDTAGVFFASHRAASFIHHLAGGESVAFGIGFGEGSTFGFDPEAAAQQDTLALGPAYSHTVTLRPDRVEAMLGTPLAPERIEAILTGFGLQKSEDGWEIPSYRQDLQREIDLIEEIARVVGIDAIPARLSGSPAPSSAADLAYDFAMGLRQKLVGLGLSEARTSTLVSAARRGEAVPALGLKNPLGEDQSFLRTSLVPGLLGAITHNLRQGARTVALYEVGRTFKNVPGDEESPTLALVLTGEASVPDWRGTKPRELDWHDAKGLVESLAPATFAKREASPAPLTLSADIVVSGQTVGLLGQLAPAAARDLDATGPVLVVELSLVALQKALLPTAYSDIPRFPSTKRDIAIVAPSALGYGEIENVLRTAKDPLLASVELLSVFSDPTGEKLPADRKSVAISLTFRADGRTLTTEEANAASERLKQRLKAELAVDFRE